MKTVPGFEKKLSLYAITGAAAFAASGGAGASIVHVTVGQSFSSSTPPSVYNLSPTGNVTPDIVVSAGPAPYFGSDYAIQANTSGTAGVRTDSGQVAALAFGDLIDPGSATGWGNGGKMIDGISGGPWSSSGDASYLGFYFTDGDGVHAGWADIATSIATNLNGDVTGSAFTVIDYAYETVADEAITAGQLQEVTPSVPEPASIALLAMGAAGIAAVRRRRASA